MPGGPHPVDVDYEDLDFQWKKSKILVERKKNSQPRVIKLDV
jgi:hypothetical protein